MVVKKKVIKKKEAKKKETKKEVVKSKEVLIGVVSNYFDHVGVAAIKVKTGLKKGDKIRIVGGNVDFEQIVNSMQIDHKPVTEAKKGDDVGIKLKEKVRKDYKIYKK
jgi:translation elongation factor EF-1alpha